MKRSKFTNGLHLDAYLYVVLKQMHPDKSLDANAVSVLNQLASCVLDQFACFVSHLHSISKRDTLGQREIEFATRPVLWGEYGARAKREAERAIKTYNADVAAKTKSKSAAPTATSAVRPQKTTAPPSSSKKAHRRMLSSRAGLVFPVPRITKYLMSRVPFVRKSVTASIYLTAALECIIAVVLESAGNYARDAKKKRITPRAIFFAIGVDPYLGLSSRISFNSLVCFLTSIPLTTPSRWRMSDWLHLLEAASPPPAALRPIN